MKVLHTVSDVRQEVRATRATGKSIALVPTMGALHEGHMSLVTLAKERADYVIVSVFVNPTQFAPTEDLDKYPRTLDEDCQRCRDAGVDLIFAPNASEMYPPEFDSWVDVNRVTKVLEGESRPTHFRGVTTVCAKLFNISQADYAIFGMKDYQQLKVIEKMVRDLNMPLEIIPAPIVREPDGLAKSSRNRYLSTEERNAALILQKSLQEAKRLYASGERNAQSLELAVVDVIVSEPLAKIDYVAVADAQSLIEIEALDRQTAVLLAVRIGNTRLIDNVVLG